MLLLRCVENGNSLPTQKMYINSFFYSVYARERKSGFNQIYELLIAVNVQV